MVHGFKKNTEVGVESLVRFSEHFPTEDLTVITWDYEDREERNGKLIRFVPYGNSSSNRPNKTLCDTGCSDTNL